MIIKKSQRQLVDNEPAQTEKTEEPTAPQTAAKTAGSGKANDVESVSKLKVRLSADIEHQAYIKLKTYSAVVRKPVVSIVQDLIYANCNL